MPENEWIVEAVVSVLPILFDGLGGVNVRALEMAVDSAETGTGWRRREAIQKAVALIESIREISEREEENARTNADQS